MSSHPTTAAIETAPNRKVAERMAPLLANKLALVGGALALVFFALAIAGALVMVVDRWNDLYLDQNLRNSLLLPGEKGYLLGTDNLGRSMFWRLTTGLAVSLWAGVAVTAISIVVGMALGAIAGYRGGWYDRVISGLIDLTWGFPVILVAVIFVGMLQPGLTAVILAIGVVNWAGYARVVRAQVLTLKQRSFVEAARALGVPTWKIVFRHLVPNMIGTTLVMASYYIAVTVIAEAGMSFIGLGAQPPTPSLGQMVSEGRKFLSKDIWMVAMPGGAIALIVLALNALGDGLRDIYDPRLRRW